MIIKKKLRNIQLYNTLVFDTEPFNTPSLAESVSFSIAIVLVRSVQYY